MSERGFLIGLGRAAELLPDDGDWQWARIRAAIDSPVVFCDRSRRHAPMLWKPEAVDAMFGSVLRDLKVPKQVAHVYVAEHPGWKRALQEI